MKKVLYCGKLLDTVKECVLENMAVIVDGDRVESVFPRAEYTPENGVEIVDLSDAFVLPGLIDMHVHIHCDACTTEDLITTSVPQMTLSSLRYSRQDMLCGFTTLRNEYTPYFVDVAVRDSIDSGRFWGPRIFACGIGITGTGGHADAKYAYQFEDVPGGGAVVNSADEARKAGRLMLKYGATHFKMCATGGVTSPGDDPGAQELTYEEMRAYCEIAQFAGVPVSAHAHGSKGIQDALRAGATFIEHATMADDETLTMMKEYGAYYCPTLLPFRLIGEMDLPEWMKAKYHSCGGAARHRDVVRKAKALGIPIIFGADRGCPGIAPGSQFREFDELVTAGLTHMEAILSATRTAAEALKMDTKLGAISSGMYADIVACKRDPLQDITALHEIDFVMKGGDIFKRNGVAQCMM